MSSPDIIMLAPQHHATMFTKLNVPAMINTPQTCTQYGSGVLFPWKLHEMLEAAEANRFTSVVSWLPDHRSFKVHDKETFVSLIMTRYFDQTKDKSFQRQLNMWGFERHLDGASKGGYTHPCLVRGKPSLCYRMKRCKKAGASSGISSKKAISTTAKKAKNHLLLLPRTLGAKCPSLYCILNAALCLWMMNHQLPALKISCWTLWITNRSKNKNSRIQKWSILLPNTTTTCHHCMRM
jgi:hypothetical protein